MPRATLRRRKHAGPCTCAMRNSYRFLEPVLLLMLKEKGRSYGYDLSESLEQYALTDAQIERAALYRTLRALEANGHVTSRWDTDNGGPARRVYSLTKKGLRHVEEWAQLLGRLGEAMTAFAKRASTLTPGRREAEQQK